MTENSKRPVIINGINVAILLDQCKHLADKQRGSSTSFQYTSALDNCVSIIKTLMSIHPANDDILFCLNGEELQAFSDLLHGRAHVRFNPEEKWTAEKLMVLRQRVDAELALTKAEKPLS